ncbi:MAG: 2,3-bisphosphoglycerate-independent phosphoglycerate mutase [Planctomycetota bacterium]|nr:MAG: 2,3-bisphosphoglycerate-independent phosphoglycerate mutase [Planctomycetota bacterium]
MSPKTPALLLILDGWGHAPPGASNAITQAPAARFQALWDEWPHCLLSASGEEVGLPLGLMGNSEVGHTNIGAGRVVYQEITRIDKDIREGGFQRNGAIRGAIEHARRTGGALHLMGLLGNGGVHASDRHYLALLELAASMGLPGERVFFQAILDGRDTPPDSSAGFVQELDACLRAPQRGRIATISGRYYAMDRDRRWDRTRKFWDAIVHGVGERAGDPMQAVRNSFARGLTDEFVLPTIIGDPAAGRVRDGDAVFAFNFRADRMRAISQAFLFPEFAEFERGRVPQVHYATMTQYRADFPCPVAYPPRALKALFGELAAARGLTQFRCAETEKYAHVTFFFNGGREEPYAGEERVLVPSPRVATYDLQPEMCAAGVTDEVLRRLERGAHDVYVVNFANADMVGHTGIQPAAEKAVRTVDDCVGRIVAEALRRGGCAVITADHGNAEMMVDPVTGGPHTAHTTNPVPFVLAGARFRGARLRAMGILADVAPTLMEGMGIPQPVEMDGRSLLRR